MGIDGYRSAKTQPMGSDVKGLGDCFIQRRAQFLQDLEPAELWLASAIAGHSCNCISREKCTRDIWAQTLSIDEHGFFLPSRTASERLILCPGDRCCPTPPPGRSPPVRHPQINSPSKSSPERERVNLTSTGGYSSVRAAPVAQVSRKTMCRLLFVLMCILSHILTIIYRLQKYFLTVKSLAL